MYKSGVENMEIKIRNAWENPIKPTKTVENGRGVGANTIQARMLNIIVSKNPEIKHETLPLSHNRFLPWRFFKAEKIPMSMCCEITNEIKLAINNLRDGVKRASIPNCTALL